MNVQVALAHDAVPNDVVLPRDHQTVRDKIMARAKQFGLTMVDMGPAMGRSRAYMHNYIKRGTPAVLPPDLRAKLAQILDLDEQELCVPGEMTRTASQARALMMASDKMSYPVQLGGAPCVPLYQQHDDINPGDVHEWVVSPSNVPAIGGMFALLIHTETTRARAGDVVYVANRRPRPGDMAVALLGTRVVAVGDIQDIDETAAVMTAPTGHLRLELPRHRLLKVTTIAPA